MPLLYDVLNAYLAPLLNKHNSGKVVTYDDLTSSLEAAKSVLVESPNEFILVRRLLKKIVIDVFSFDDTFLFYFVSHSFIYCAARNESRTCMIHRSTLTVKQPKNLLKIGR